MMAKFTGGSANTQMELSIHHYAASDTGPDRQANECICASTGSEGPFPERDCTHIVDQGDRQLHLIPNNSLQRDIEPLAWQVGQNLYHAAINIRRSGYANSHTFNCSR